jgi:hypothetical protein
MSIKVFQLQKRDSKYFDIQDRFSINSQKKSIALADGTTQSYNSKIWAELITKGFTNNPILNFPELIDQFKKDSHSFRKIEHVFDSTHAIASLQSVKSKKGGTATFLGLQFVEENLFEVICSGDTNLFKLTVDSELSAFPFSTRDALDANSHFLNSEDLLNEKVNEGYFVKARFQLNENEIVILVTDALSRFFLEYPRELIDFIKINSFEDFHNFCLKNWNEKKLQDDDISAIIIQDEMNDDCVIFCPPIEDRDADAGAGAGAGGKPIDMTEIKDELRGIKNEILQLKERQKRSEIFQYVIISMLFLLLAFTYLKFNRVNKEKSVSKENIKKSTGIKGLKLKEKEAN